MAVVLPLHQGAPWIEATLASVGAQRRPPDEVIVVDDGSTDGGPRLVRERFPDVRLLTSPVPGGAPARNHGWRAADAEWVAFLDQDDLWHPEHLARLEQAADAHAEASTLVSASFTFHDGDVPRFRALRAGTRAVDPWLSFPWSTPVRTPACALMRREALEEVGGLEADLTGIGDAVLWLELSVERPLLGLEAATVARRLRPGSQVQRLRAQGESYLELHRRGMERALAFRLRRLGEHAPDPAAAARAASLVRRLDLLDASRALLSALQRGADAALEGQRFEDAWAGAPDVRLADVYQLWTRTLLPGHDRRALRRRRFALLETLLARWPAAARSSREALLRFAAGRTWPVGTFLKALGRGDWSRVRLLLALLVRRVG